MTNGYGNATNIEIYLHSIDKQTIEWTNRTAKQKKRRRKKHWGKKIYQWNLISLNDLIDSYVMNAYTLYL